MTKANTSIELTVGDLFTVRHRKGEHSKLLDCSDATGLPGFRGRTFIATAVEREMICASLGVDKATFEYVQEKTGGTSRLLEHRGKAIAIADIIDCRPMTKDDEEAACCKVYPKAFSWALANVRKIEPFAVKGQLGIFNVDVTDKIKGKGIN